MRLFLALTVILVGALADRKLKTAKCERDGIYIFDEFSLVMCSNGIGYHQPCPPGTKNSGLSYGFGYTHTHTVFCDVNLNDLAHNHPIAPQHHPVVVASHEVYSHPVVQQPAPHHQEVNTHNVVYEHHQPVVTHTHTTHQVVHQVPHHQDVHPHHQDVHPHHQEVHPHHQEATPHHQVVYHQPPVHYHDPAVHHQPTTNQVAPQQHHSTFHEYSSTGGSSSSSSGGLIPVPIESRTHSTDPVYYHSSTSQHNSF